MRLKLDPGSKITGLVLVEEKSGQVLFAAELRHRGQQIPDSLTSRRALRRARRNRKTRYRAPRFHNRRRPEGWLAPSLEASGTHDRHLGIPASGVRSRLGYQHGVSSF